MAESSTSHVLIFIVAVVACIGAINWLLTAMNFNLVEKLTKNTKVQKTLYVIIGLCGLVLLAAKIMFVNKYGFNYSCSPGL